MSSALKRWWPEAALGVTLWFCAAFFLLGDIGLWNDDWFYIQRVPETGAVRALVLDQPVHFWRPLYRIVVPVLGTLLWEHAWVNHLIQALAHGANAGLLWWLLVRVGMRRMAAAVGAIVFLVFPWSFEAVLWLCCLPTTLSLGVMLGALHAAVSWADRGVRLAGAAGAMTFLACCLNEQPAVLGAGAPLVVMAMGGGAVRAMCGAAGWGAAMGAYVAMHLSMAGGTGDIGGAHGVAPVSEWVRIAGSVAWWTAGLIASDEWIGRAWLRGTEALGAHPWRATGAGAAVVTCGGVWVRAMARRGDERTRRGGEWWVLGAGAAMAVLPLGPVVVFDYWLNPRMLYPSAVGLGVVIAALGSMWPAQRPSVRGVAAGLVAMVFAGMALAMVGAQESFRIRHEADTEVLAEVRRVAGRVEPGSVLTPARMELPQTGALRYEWCFWPVLGSWWSAGPAARLALGRSDVSCGHSVWERGAMRFAAWDGVRVEGVGRVSWELVVPFEVDAEGNVRFITDVRFVSAEGEERRVRVPQTGAMSERREIGERVFEMKEAEHHPPPLPDGG